MDVLILSLRVFSCGTDVVREPDTDQRWQLLRSRLVSSGFAFTTTPIQLNWILDVFEPFGPSNVVGEVERLAQWTEGDSRCPRAIGV